MKIIPEIFSGFSTSKKLQGRGQHAPKAVIATNLPHDSDTPGTPAKAGDFLRNHHISSFPGSNHGISRLSARETRPKSMNPIRETTMSAAKIAGVSRLNWELMMM